MIAILYTILPMGCILLVGFILEKTVKIDQTSLSRLAFYVLLPALVTDSLYRATLSAENTIALVASCILVYVIICPFSWWLGKRLGWSVSLQKSFIATTAYPNTAYMGFPVSLFLLGEAGLERSVVYAITHSILAFSIIPAWLKGGNWRSAGIFTLKLPIIWGMLLALTLRMFHLQIPFKLDEVLRMLGQASIPVSLIFLGMQIASTPFKIGRDEIVASLVRLLGSAMIAYLVGKGMNITNLNLQVLVLQSAMPAAVTSVLIADEFGGDTPYTARVVVISTLLFFVTLPLVMWAIGVSI